MKFKEGDWVICIEGYGLFLTLGKSYKVEYVTEPSLLIPTQYRIKDESNCGYWTEEYFKLDVVKMRKIKLEKLNETIL